MMVDCSWPQFLGSIVASRLQKKPDEKCCACTTMVEKDELHYACKRSLVVVCVQCIKYDASNKYDVESGVERERDPKQLLDRDFVEVPGEYELGKDWYCERINVIKPSVQHKDSAKGEIGNGETFIFIYRNILGAQKLWHLEKSAGQEMLLVHWTHPWFMGYDVQFQEKNLRGYSAEDFLAHKRKSSSN